MSKSNQLWDWAKDCAAGAAAGSAVGGKVGAEAGAIGGAIAGGGVGAAPGAAGAATVAATVGGIYGCLQASGSLERAGQELDKLWERAKGSVTEWADDALDWISDAVLGRRRKKKKGRKPSPPTTQQAMLMVLDHLERRGGSPNGVAPYIFEMPVKGGKWRPMDIAWALNPSVIADLFGPEAVSDERYEPRRLYNDLATLYRLAPNHWPPGVQFTIALKRVGDARSIGKMDVKDWPLLWNMAEGDDRIPGSRAHLATDLSGDRLVSSEDYNNKDADTPDDEREGSWTDKALHGAERLWSFVKEHALEAW